MKSSVKMAFLAAAVGVFTVAGPSSAVEPDGNEFAGTGDFLNTLSGAMTIADWFSISNADEISFSGDNDFHIIACKTTGRKVRNIQVSFNHSEGDLDIEVKSLSGTSIGTSTGVTDFETVPLTGSTRNAVQLKVYGWAGAINDYGLFFQCVP